VHLPNLTTRGQSKSYAAPSASTGADHCPRLRITKRSHDCHDDEDPVGALTWHGNQFVVRTNPWESISCGPSGFGAVSLVHHWASAVPESVATSSAPPLRRRRGRGKGLGTRSTRGAATGIETSTKNKEPSLYARGGAALLVNRERKAA